MNNFLAETVNFFLSPKEVQNVSGEFKSLHGGLTSFISRPSNAFAAFDAGSKYYMDLVLTKNKDMVMYEGPAAFQYPGGRANITGSARGIHYGPAMRWTNESSTENSLKEDDHIRNNSDPAFAAYTPPYFYGTAIARFEFDPSSIDPSLSGPGNSFALEDIQDATKIYFYNLCVRHPEFAQKPEELTGLAGSDMRSTGYAVDSSNTPASASFMHLSASFQLKGKLNSSVVT